MAKVEFWKVDGQPKVPTIECPGCEMRHQLPDWEFNGDVDRPTFRPSLLVTWEHGPEREKRRCHSYITDGKIKFLGDCTHALVGQTVELPAIE